MTAGVLAEALAVVETAVIVVVTEGEAEEGDLAVERTTKRNGFQSPSWDGSFSRYDSVMLSCFDSLRSIVQQ